MEQKKLNPTIVYVLAILGLLCCCVGGLGFILAGIAFFIAHSKIKAAKENPEEFDPSSIKSMNTAKIVALVILIINVLYFFTAIFQIYSMGGWDTYMEKVNKMMEQYQNQVQF